jgi:hypothetical protein
MLVKHKDLFVFLNKIASTLESENIYLFVFS